MVNSFLLILDIGRNDLVISFILVEDFLQPETLFRYRSVSVVKNTGYKELLLFSKILNYLRY